MANSNPVYISSNNTVVITDPYVIFYQLVPISISWDNTAQTEYFIVNSTGQNIPITSPSYYLDANSVQQTQIIAGTSLDIIKNNLNAWIEVTSPNPNPTPVSGNVVDPYLPVATSVVLGGIKVGTNLTITPDGTLSATESTVATVDWSTITNKPSFATVATSGSYTDLTNTPNIYSFTGTALQYTKGDGTYGVLANVALSGSYISLSNQPNIPAQVNLTPGTNITITGTYPNLTINSSGGGGGGFVSSITTTGTSGVATVISGVLNIPNYTSSTFAGLTTSGSTGVATFVAGILNVPNYSVGSLLAANNLSDVPNMALARTNLGVPATVNIIAGANMAVSGVYPNITVSASTGSATPTSLPIVSGLGIVTGGTDQTSALNTIFLNANYAGITLDFTAPGAVTINGTLNAQGKVIRFVAGTSFQGTGTITNVIIEAGYRQKCFATTITLTNIVTSNNYFSATWYGADPTGIADSAPAINQSINTVINNFYLDTIFIPGGSYIINSPLLMMNWNGSVYAQHSVNLIGEGKFWQGSPNGGTRITTTFRNTFALGIQGGKGNIIKGIYFKGGFTPPGFSLYQFYTATFASFTDGVSRDTRYSPYSGIVIDPFGLSVPADGGYPGLTANYRGGTGGSTGTNIIDCIITNFVCGIITSPNGTTANAELMNWTQIQFDDNKCCIAATQTQEKLNLVTMTACWDNTHTFFENQTYGLQVPGHWVIKGVNIAGKLNRFINRNGAGYFPMHVTDVYAEGLGTVGRWLANQGDSLQDSTFNLVTPDVFPAYPNFPTTSHFDCTGLSIKNCIIRYYGWFLPMVFNGGFFEDCALDQVPWAPTSGFINSGCASGPLGSTSDIIGVPTGTASRYLAGGRGKIFKNQEYVEGKQISLNFGDSIPSGFLNIDNLAGTASTVVVSANVMTVTPPGGATDVARVILQRLAMDQTSGNLLGVVTAVGSTTYTISYVPDGIVSGSYAISLFCPAQNYSFMGTCTAGSPTITNVTVDFGALTDLQTYGGGFVKIPNFYGFRSYSQGAKILSLIGTTITMDRPAYANCTNCYFASNSTIKEIKVLSINNSSYFSGSGLSSTEIFPKGARYYTDTPFSGANGRQEFIVTQTGFYNSSPQATWCELTAPWCSTTTTTTTT